MSHLRLGLGLRVSVAGFLLFRHEFVWSAGSLDLGSKVGERTS